ncbi:MAG TPA: hypothetical protein VFH15_02180, partial [Pyrinomonadaceae bacterium]|nr:hypothetical protein [Pyrinomonadaceae bacterium]
MSEKSLSYKRVLFYLALAVLASTAALILSRTVFLPWLVETFVLLPVGNAASWRLFATVALILSAVAFVVLIVVHKLGPGRSLPYLRILIITLITVHLLTPRLFSFDILFVPLALTLAVVLIALQASQLRSLNTKLTERLIHSSSSLNSLQADQTRGRLNSSLKLLETMLSPQEVIVFQSDGDGKLVARARLRSPGAVSLDSSRISTWRD